MVSNILAATGLEYLDPINDFSNALLRVSIEELRHGAPIEGDPLFNGRIGDGHFSALGCKVWAEAVGRRVALLVDRRRAEAVRPR
jgi:hypothetical protein